MKGLSLLLIILWHVQCRDVPLGAVIMPVPLASNTSAKDKLERRM